MIRSRLPGPERSMSSGRLWASRTATSTTTTLATEAGERVQAGRRDRDRRSLAEPAEERRVERDPAEGGRDREADRLHGVLQVHQRHQRQPGPHRRHRRRRRRRRRCPGRRRARSRPSPSVALRQVAQTVAQSRSSERAEQDVRREQDEPGLQQVPRPDPDDLGGRRGLGAGALGDRGPERLDRRLEAPCRCGASAAARPAGGRAARPRPGRRRARPARRPRCGPRRP